MSQKNKKKILTIVYACVLSLLLAGCRKNQLGENQKNEQSIENTENAEAVASPLSDVTAELSGDTQASSREYSHEYARAYDGLIAHYYNVLSYKKEIKTDEYGSVTESGMERISSFVWYGEGNPASQVGYQVADMNGDAIPELIIGTISDTEAGYIAEDILASYTLSEGEPVLLFAENDWEIYYYLEDGTVYNSFAAGYDYFSVYHHQIKNGSLQTLSFLTIDFSEGDNGKYYWNVYDDNGNSQEESTEISEAEYYQKLEAYQKKRVELIPFSKLDVFGEEASAQEENDVNAEDAENYVIVGCPSWEYYLAQETLEPKSQSLHLEQTSVEENDIVDTELWFAENDFDISEYYYWNTAYHDRYTLSQKNVESYEYKGCIEDESYIFGIYGNYGDATARHIVNLYDKKTHEYLKTFDFCDFQYYPNYVAQDYAFITENIQWVQSKEGVMYVSICHNTYASSASGNAYIVAVEIETGNVLWKTQPLVSNASSFEIINDAIVCGYGFTAEPDYLYILDLLTGKVQEQIKLKSGPDYIIRRDDTLYVRTYDRNYTFQIF